MPDNIKKSFLLSMLLGAFFCSFNLLGQKPETPFRPWSYDENSVKPVDIRLTTEYRNARPPRLVENLNSDWTFDYLPATQEEEKIAATDYDDSNWKAIALPHTWQTYETTGDVHPYIKNASERDDPYWWKGWGYYRKRFKIGNETGDKQFFLEFDGVQKYAKIYLNGNYIRDHKGGFNSFSVDVTPRIKIGQENILVVMVNNSRRDKFAIPPMTAGNWDVYGGIYRDVRLVVKNKVYIPYQGNADQEGGTFITTPEVSHTQAKVHIRTYVQNAGNTDKEVMLATSILDADGKPIAEIKRTQSLRAGSLSTFEQETKISNPKLWHPDSPNLYKVVSKVFTGDSLRDTYESPLGLRYFRWDYGKNILYINGEPINIKGINRHQEYPWLGDAIPDWITIKDMQDIKYGLGHNFMRAGHYPNDPLVYDLADRFGMVMVEEVPNIKSIDFSEEVQESNLREMIRRDRNHPGIFFWSMGNETSDAADSKWAVEEDTTRIIHQRKSEEAGDFVDHDHTNLDMENLLRVTVHGWFTQDDAPKDVDARPENGQHASSEAWQHQMAMKRGGSVRGVLNDNTVGWLYEDHGADREYKNSPLLHINAKGWVDNYRIPKYLYYLTRANYTQDPVLFIQPHYWRKRYIGQKKDFVLDSNCEEVKLFVDDSLIGTVHPDQNKFNSVVVENVPVQNGSLKAVGKKGGQEIMANLKMHGEPVKIILESTDEAFKADRSGLAVITAYLLDASDNVVYDATNTLQWEVSGAATLVGPPKYESDIAKHEAMEGTGYMVGPVSNIVRTTNRAGEIIVKVTSPGLESGSIQLVSHAPTTPASSIGQPVLDDTGRRAVKKIENFTEQIAYRKIIPDITENKDFSKGDKKDYRLQLEGFVQSKGKEAKNYPAAFDLFVAQLNRNLIKLNGKLIADDFNFMAGQFNDYAMLKRAIASSNLHVDYAKLLETYYASRMLEQNKPIAVEDEIAMLQGIPAEHVPLYIYGPTDKNPEGKVEDNYVKKLFKVWANDPVDAILTAFPSYKDLGPEERERVYRHIARVTPYVDYDPDRKTFRFEKEKMLLIPSPEVDDYLGGLKE